MTPFLTKPLTLACVLGSIALLVEVALVARYTGMGRLSLAADVVVPHDLSIKEGVLLFHSAKKDIVQLTLVSDVSFALCALVTWLGLSALRDRPAAAMALSAVALAVCTLPLATMVAQAVMAFWSIPWRDIAIHRAVDDMLDGHLVMPARFPDPMILPLSLLPYLLPVPAIALGITATGRLRASFGTQPP